MRSTLGCTFVACLLAAAIPARAQGEMSAAPQPRFTREAISHAISAAARDAAQPDRQTSRPVAGPAAETNRSWDTLAATVKTGEKVKITFKNLSDVEGELAAIDTRSISVRSPGGLQTIDVADVFRVQRAGVRKHHVLRGMLIGMLVGAVSLPIIDQQSSQPEPIEAAEIGAIIFGLPLGAIAGALVPIGPPLYEAASPR